MQRAIKWTAWALAGVLAVIALAAFTINLVSDRKAQRTISVEIGDVPFSADASVLDQGKYLYESRGCSECHGANGAGKVVINDEKSGLFVKSPSIVSGNGGVVAKYASIDWVRAIRHGIKPDGKPLLVMPSEEYNRLSDADLTALVAYIRTLPATDGVPGVVKFPLLVKALYAFDFVQDAAQKIDHTRAPSAHISASVSERYGEYVAQTCTGCHGPGFSGGKVPGAPPHWPAAANLTPAQGSALLRYRAPEQFISLFRTGLRPDGTQVSTVMPFESLQRYSDTDIRAMYLYFNSLAPRAAGGR